MQAFPHASFDQEATYLSSTFGSVERRVLGPSDGRCWYALCSTQALPPCPSPPASPRDGDDLFEIAMEGLPAAVCAQFVGASHAPLEGRALAERMTAVSGIGALLPGVVIDDWAFEPCGYSMNGLRGGFYYTIHITPEEGFSYASFETNDPAYRQPKWVGAVVGVFQPSVLTVTLTTRRVQCDLPTYALAGFERNTVETASLAGGVTMCCLNFAAEVEGGCGSRKRKLAAGCSPIGCELSASLSFEADASASSAGSGSDGESASEVSSVIDESPGSPDVLPASGAKKAGARCVTERGNRERSEAAGVRATSRGIAGAFGRGEIPPFGGLSTSAAGPRRSRGWAARRAPLCAETIQSWLAGDGVRGLKPAFKDAELVCGRVWDGAGRSGASFSRVRPGRVASERGRARRTLPVFSVPSSPAMLALRGRSVLAPVCVRASALKGSIKFGRPVGKERAVFWADCLSAPPRALAQGPAPRLPRKGVVSSPPPTFVQLTRTRAHTHKHVRRGRLRGRQRSTKG
eukprot:2190724-Prymnesium_polylepis.1